MRESVLKFHKSNSPRKLSKYQLEKDSNLSKIRELTKPVLKELKEGICNIRGLAPTFGFAPMNFSTRKDSYWSMITHDILSSKRTDNLYLKKLLQNYDVEAFKQKKMLENFTCGK